MKVYLLSAEDRAAGIKTLLEQFSPNTYAHKRVAVKANFNSADPFPASTHPETLRAILTFLKGQDAQPVLAERSGMGRTDQVLSRLGIFSVFSPGEVITLDSLPKDQFSRFQGDHWKRGFLLARVFLEADCVINTCCLKTHRFGGHFTLSLKNAVGAVARYDPEDHYDYMQELHSSPYQRQMIAEINACLPCHLVILDATSGFSTMGPEQGKRIEPHLLLATGDRVAADAVGVALLRHAGTTPEVEKGSIFEQEQIKRAVQLGIGVKSAKEMELVPLDGHSAAIARKLDIS